MLDADLAEIYGYRALFEKLLQEGDRKNDDFLHQ
jgi:hypothetical protein